MMTATRLRSMRVPGVFALATLLGLGAVRALPQAAQFVAVPSMVVLKDYAIVDWFLLPIKLAAYSLFPWTLDLWWTVASAILLMSFVLGSRLSDRQYFAALIIGGLMGGAAFVLTSPRGVLIGPALAGYGMIGFYCIVAARDWKTLHWLARLYSLLVFAVIPYSIAKAAFGSSETRFAEAAALLAAGSVGVKVLLNARNPALVSPAVQE